MNNFTKYMRHTYTCIISSTYHNNLSFEFQISVFRSSVGTIFSHARRFITPKYIGLVDFSSDTYNLLFSNLSALPFEYLSRSVLMIAHYVRSYYASINISLWHVYNIYWKYRLLVSWMMMILDRPSADTNIL